MELFTQAFNLFTNNSGLPSLHTVASEEYYKDIDATATDEVLKLALKELLQDKTTLSYDDVWTAFGSVDKFLPGYPCSSDTS